jgi:hypothetical protein
MQDFASSFERLMALFRYRGLDSTSLTPSSGATLQALMEAGQKVVKDLEDLARRQAAVIETSTRQLMGNAQALARPDQFKDASETNLKTLTKVAETTMNHLGELAELLMKYNSEIVSTMNRGAMDAMRGAEAAGEQAMRPMMKAAAMKAPAPVATKTPSAPKAKAKAKARKPAAKARKK